MRITPLLVFLLAACVPASGRPDSAHASPYTFVAHLELDRDLGAVSVDGAAPSKGLRDVERRYANEADAQQHTIALRAHGTELEPILPGQCTKSCVALGTSNHQVHCDASFDHEEVLVSLGRKSGTTLISRKCSGPGGSFELTPS